MPRSDGRDVPVFTVELGLRNSELKLQTEVSTPRKTPRRHSRTRASSFAPPLVPTSPAKPPTPEPRPPSPLRRPPTGRRRSKAPQAPQTPSAREEEAPQRSSRDHRHVRIAAATVDSKAAQQTETARTRSPTRSPIRSPPLSRRSSPRAVTVLGLHGRPPSMLERSEAWQKQREEKLQALREKCQAEIGSFSPNLYRPVRSPRWLAGPEGGGGLFERGMRSIARRALEKRRHEEAQLESELLQCPFTPKLSTWSPDSRPSSATASPSPKRKPLRAAVASLAWDERPNPEGQVTPERAKEFYQKQQAWFEAKQEEQDELRKEHVFRTLQEEAEARKSERPPRGETGSLKVGGVLSRTVYDRQIAWLRQRDAELLEQRRSQFEAVTSRDSFGSGNDTPRRRPMSAPVTPQRKLEAPTASGAGAALLAKLKAARYLDDEPPAPRRHTEPRGLWSRPPRRRSGMVACTTCSRPCPVDVLHCKHCGQKRLKVAAARGDPCGLDYTANFGWPPNSEEYLMCHQHYSRLGMCILCIVARMPSKEMGGGVSGGTRTQLAGTFLAEQTHFQPPKYTLVSVSSALGPDGCPRHVPSSSSAAERNGRIRPSGGPAPVMTVIPALADIEPLLKGFQLAEDNEQSKPRSCAELRRLRNGYSEIHGCNPTTVKSAGRVEQGSKEKEANEDSPPRPRRGGARGAAERDAAAASEELFSLPLGMGLRHTAAEARRGSLTSFLEGPHHQTAFLAQWNAEQLLQRRAQLRVAFGIEGGVAASGSGLFMAKLIRIARRIQAEEEAREKAGEEQGDDDEDQDVSSKTHYRAVNRLCAGRHTPWVAKRTDAELYSYLAQRSRDPNMAKLAASAELASPKAADSTDSSPRSKARQKHSSHNELFDSCLRQDRTCIAYATTDPHVPGSSFMKTRGPHPTTAAVNAQTAGPQVVESWRLPSSGADTIAAQHKSPGRVAKMAGCFMFGKTARADLQDLGSGQAASQASCWHAMREFRRNGQWKKAQHLLALMPSRSFVSHQWQFSSAISCFGEAAQWQRAFLALVDLSFIRSAPDLITYSAAAGASQAGAQWWVPLQLISSMLQTSVVPDRITFTCAISSCEKGFRWQTARHILSAMPCAASQPSVLSFSASISACARVGHWQPALQILVDMSQVTAAPNRITMNSAITACRSGALWQLALASLSKMPLMALVPDLVTISATMTACDAGGPWQIALHLFSMIYSSSLTPDLIAFSTSISSCEKGGCWQTALLLLSDMLHVKVLPDIIILNAAISSCGKGMQWQMALHLLSQVLTMWLHPDTVSFSAAVTACEKAARWEQALKLLLLLPTVRVNASDTISYGAGISACEKGCRWHRAVQLFADIPVMRTEASQITFNATLSACEKGFHWQSSLRLLYNMPLAKPLPDEVSFGAVISSCARGPDSSTKCLSNALRVLELIATQLFSEISSLAYQDLTTQRTRPASQERPKARERALTDRLYGDYLRRKERAKARELLAGVPWDKDKTESEMLFTQSTMTPRPSDMFSSRFSELIEDRRPILWRHSFSESRRGMTLATGPVLSGCAGSAGQEIHGAERFFQKGAELSLLSLRCDKQRSVRFQLDACIANQEFDPLSVALWIRKTAPSKANCLPLKDAVLDFATIWQGTAYQAYQLALQPYRYSSIEEASIPVPKAPPKAKARPAESSGGRPCLTDEPVVDLPRSGLLFNPDTFGRGNFRVEDSQRIEGKVVIFDFHNVIDRYFWAQRIGQRKTQYKIPYPKEAPELLVDIQSPLRRIHRAVQEVGALVVICSHIGENSRSIEDWALDTLPFE
eukprot:s3020_g1.t2